MSPYVSQRFLTVSTNSWRSRRFVSVFLLRQTSDDSGFWTSSGATSISCWSWYDSWSRISGKTAANCKGRYSAKPRSMILEILVSADCKVLINVKATNPERLLSESVMMFVAERSPWAMTHGELSSSGITYLRIRLRCRRQSMSFAVRAVHSRLAWSYDLSLG